jgi:peptidoglycan lytic transglycosylase
MGPEWKLPLRRKRNRWRPAQGAFALLALSAATAGLLVQAPRSLAGSGAGANQAQRHSVFRRGLASWYYDDGHRTACGFHAKFGVAHRTLRCGTKVTFLHSGHRITAVVDDRGPYISGRTWDLDERSARALHVSGVQYVWAKW